ncbi:hypothetical protein T492DRAFT_283887 [Pavlovales sp. CCMP2436]|nr:hypothetical protein T492DRAFT_283887 [Pavlovales sp. CCMP2436]
MGSYLFCFVLFYFICDRISSFCGCVTLSRSHLVFYFIICFMHDRISSFRGRMTLLRSHWVRRRFGRFCYA